MNAHALREAGFETRREHVRYAATLTVAVMFDAAYERPTLHTVAADVSASGLALETEYGDLDGASVTLLVVPRVGMRFDGKTLRFRARVVWNRPVPPSSGTPRYRHGFQFQPWGSDDRVQFGRWLARAFDPGETMPGTSPAPRSHRGLPGYDRTMTDMQEPFMPSAAPERKPGSPGANDAALRRAHDYFKTMAAEQNVARPKHPNGLYRVARLPEFSGLAWRSGDSFMSTRESQEGHVCTEVNLRYALMAGALLEIERDHPANERLRRALLESQIQFTVDDRRNDKGMITSSRFVVECAVKPSVTIASLGDEGGLLVRLQNVGGFGTAKAFVSPDDIDADWLDALGRFVLGQGRCPAFLSSVAYEVSA